MEITFAELSVTGPVRERNEDSVGSVVTVDPEERKTRGSLAVVADGVAGSGRGADASRSAVSAAVKIFRDSPPLTAPRQILSEIFNAANLGIYDAGMKEREQGRGATTMTAAIFRDNEVSVGHVGDSRAYVVQGSAIRRLTADHSYSGLQTKMGFLSEAEAKKSPSRLMLMRCVGRDPFVRVDYSSVIVGVGNVILLCSDGIHGALTDDELLDAALRYSPQDACRHLVALAERRGTDDNISIQVVRIDRVQVVSQYRGIAYYPENQPGPLKGDSEVGKVLDDRFEITDLISEGGMGTVYRALDRKTQETVAVKIPFMKYESDPGSYTRFEREDQIGRLLQHPSILRIIPVDTKSRPYLVTEYLEGQTLAQLLASVRPFPIEDGVRITSRLCEGLHHMHERQVVHRDLKPENIMVCSDGSLRIMDFGIAKSPGDRNLSLKGLTPTMGTPDYMAPEQVRGQAGDEHTDIYSLGAILYQMATGRTPFQGDNAFVIMNSRLSGDPEAPRKIRPEISPVLEEIILHAMERDPGNRYLSCIGFQSDLDHQDLVGLTGRVDRLQPPKPWKTQWRRFRTPVYALLIVLGLFSAIYLLSHGPKREPSTRHGRAGELRPTR